MPHGWRATTTTPTLPTMTLRQHWDSLVRPVYGGPYFEVKPKRWWSPRARRSARIAAAVANAQAPDTTKILSDMAIYGMAVTDSSGRRIDPRNLSA